MWSHEWNLYMLRGIEREEMVGGGKGGGNGKANWLRDREGTAKVHMMPELSVSLFYKV